MGAVVLDIGNYIKAGFAGDDCPRSSFPALLGVPKRSLRGCCGTYFGEEALARGTSLHLAFPLDRDTVTDWEAMSHVLHNMFYEELRAVPEESPVLLCEQPLPCRGSRLKFAEILFEQHDVPELHCEPGGSLHLLCSGLTDGVALHCGYSASHAAPVVEGRSVISAVRRSEIGGRDVTNLLGTLLASQFRFVSHRDVDFLGEIAASVAAVAEAHSTRREESQKPYELPDGTLLQIGRMGYDSTEPLFRPQIIGSEALGLHELAASAISAANASPGHAWPWEAYETTGKLPVHPLSIVLGGGCARFQGISSRVYGEITSLLPTYLALRVLAPAEARYSAWIGGSILRSLSDFEEICRPLTKLEYAESGSTRLLFQ